MQEGILHADEIQEAAALDGKIHSLPCHAVWWKKQPGKCAGPTSL